MNRVLIIGAGFIGSHLARHCIARGDDVHVAARPQTNLWRLASVGTDLTVHRLDLRDRGALARCFADARPEQVYHLAVRTRWTPAPDFSDVHQSIDVDLLNFITVLGAAAAADPPPRVLVRAGSLAEYGNGPVPYVEGQRESPLNAYAAVQTASTHYAQMLQPRLPFAVLTARLALVYGPNQNEDFLVAMLVRNCLAGQRTTIMRPDDQRDLLYVTDATEALCRFARSGLPGGTIMNVATGIAPQMRDVAYLVARAVGADHELIDIASAPDAAENNPSAPANICGSPALAKKLLGWKAQVTLDEGLRNLLDEIRRRDEQFEAVQ